MTETARGFLTKASLTREAQVTTPTWPATAAAAATTLLPLLAESVRERPERASVTTALGLLPPDTLARPVGGDLSLLATYNGIEHVWAMALGYMAKRYSGTVFPQQLATGVYKHRYEVDTDLRSLAWDASADGFTGGELTAGQQRIRRGTFCADKQVATWESKSAMIGSLELEASPAGVQLGLGLVAHSLTRASAVNPNLNALSDPGFHPVRFVDLVVRIAPYSTSTALSGSDVLQVSGVRLSLDNRLAAPISAVTAPAIDEPARVAPAVVQGSLFVPRYRSDALLVWADAATQLMADLVWTGPAIGATGYNYTLSVYLPGLVMLEADVPTTGPQWQQLALPFACYPKAPGAGFPSGNKAGPLVVECVTTLATNPLL